MPHERKCLRLHFRLYVVKVKLSHLKFQNSTYFQTQNSSCQNEFISSTKFKMIRPNKSRVTNYPDTQVLCYPIVQQSTEKQHLLTIHIRYRCMLCFPVFSGGDCLLAAPTSFSRGTDENRTRTVAITVVCDYLSPNKSDPPVWSTHTHAYTKKVAS